MVMPEGHLKVHQFAGLHWNALMCAHEQPVLLKLSRVVSLPEC